MAVELFMSATEYVANEITFNRGDVGDIVAVGVYMDSDPAVIPVVGDFLTSGVQVIDGITSPSDPLAEAGKIDIVHKIGPGGGAVTAGVYDFSADTTDTDYQHWLLITTADEQIIRRPDTVTIMGAP